MRLLLVEDSEVSARTTRAAVDRVCPGATIVEVGCRDDALSEIAAQEFDGIICDIRIPPIEGSAAADDEHGFMVHAAARSTCPGTPLVFLSAFATLTKVKHHIAAGGGMVTVVEKDAMEEFEEWLGDLRDRLAEVDTFCTISTPDTDDPAFEAAVKIYAKKVGHSQAAISVGRGFSGASVGRVQLTGNGPGASVFMKVHDHERTVDEYGRYAKYVQNRLDSGFFAPMLEPFHEGLGKKAALVSTLAGEGHRPISRLAADDSSGADAVKLLREALAPWRAESRTESMAVVELRRRKLSDDEPAFAPYRNEPWVTNCESLIVDFEFTIGHCDLHGENVLVDRFGRPMLIDYGDIGDHVSVVDPITLELGLIFHEDGPARGTAWANSVDWGTWPDVDAFAADSPFRNFIHECREWALAVGDEDAVLAFGYAHAMRQIRYPDPPKEAVLGVARGAAAALVSHRR